jgi:hypothetical protein
MLNSTLFAKIADAAKPCFPEGWPLLRACSIRRFARVARPRIHVLPLAATAKVRTV